MDKESSDCEETIQLSDLSEGISIITFESLFNVNQVNFDGPKTFPIF